HPRAAAQLVEVRQVAWVAADRDPREPDRRGERQGPPEPISQQSRLEQTAEYRCGERISQQGIADPNFPPFADEGDPEQCKAGQGDAFERAPRAESGRGDGQESEEADRRLEQERHGEVERPALLTVFAAEIRFMTAALVADLLQDA